MTQNVSTAGLADFLTNYLREFIFKYLQTMKSSLNLKSFDTPHIRKIILKFQSPV